MNYKTNKISSNISARLLFCTAATGRGRSSSPYASASGEIFFDVAQVRAGGAPGRESTLQLGEPFLWLGGEFSISSTITCRVCSIQLVNHEFFLAVVICKWNRMISIRLRIRLGRSYLALRSDWIKILDVAIWGQTKTSDFLVLWWCPALSHGSSRTSLGLKFNGWYALLNATYWCLVFLK
jgi:hypothetical protein